MQILKCSRGFSVILPLLGFGCGLGGKRVGFGSNTQTRNLSYMGNGLMGTNPPNRVIGLKGFGLWVWVHDPLRVVNPS